MNAFAPASLYAPRAAEILSVVDLTPEERLYRLRFCDGSELGHQPGQFVQLSIPGFAEAPISVASSSSRTGHFELAIRRAGLLTAAMHQKKPGDLVGIRGPFGNPFHLDELFGRDLLLISGGCGLAPLRSLIQYCGDFPDRFGRVQILYGARNPEFILFKDDLQQWIDSGSFRCSLTVDNVTSGSCYDGATGFVHNLIPTLEFEPASCSAVIVGPPLMYRSVIDQLRNRGVPDEKIFLSLERQMRCGVGKCGHCTIDHLYCCKDGPVFRLDQLAGVKGAI